MMYRILILLFLLVSCGGWQLKQLDKNKRETERIVNVKTPSNKAFDSALSFLSKHINNSNHAIRMKDRKSMKIIAKIGIDCVGLKRPDIVTNRESTLVDYTIDIAFKKGRIRFITTMEGFTKEVAGLGRHTMFIAQDKGQEEAVQKCNNSLIDNILAGISDKSNRDDW